MTVFELPEGCNQVDLFRHGEQAVELVGPRTRWLVAVRPLAVDERLLPELPAIATPTLRDLLDTAAVEVGALSLGALLVWASRRPLGHVDEDPRVCGGGIFNRRLVREALQPLVDAGGPKTQIDLGWFPYGPDGGAILRLISGAVTVVLMSQKPDILPTGERLPVEWRIP